MGPKPPRTRIAGLPLLAAICISYLPHAALADQSRPRNDYPTAARADYVIGCMAANGFRRDLLDRCSCGIDTIASQMNYDDYEKANTILGMQQGSLGPKAALFRDTPIARDELQKLRRAQAEVNLRCG